MRPQRTADQTRGARAGPEILDCFDRRFLERGFIGKTEVIVRRKIKESFAADFDARQLRRINSAQFTIQAAAAQVA